MLSGQGSTPIGRAAAEKLAATTTSSEGSDSGYASIGNTTEGSTTDNSQDFADGVALPSLGFFERKATKLRLFDKEIPQLTQHRFHDLHELFERPLCDYLIKAKVNPNPISIKLKVLGENEATARPWIVVLCNKTASKRIRQFFNQQQIKAEYQPPNPDSFLPAFKVFVCNRPPRPMAGAEIYGDFDKRATMCGRIIKVGEAHQSRFATLGGVIKVVEPSGIVKLYGMTAGHVLAQQSLGQDSFDEVDFCDEENEEDEGFYSGEEEYELDDSFEGDEEVQGLATTGDGTWTDSQSKQLGRLWPKIGCVSAASNEGARTGQDLDWALIEFDKQADCRPNLLVPLDCEEGVARNRPLKVNAKFTEDGSSRSVVLLSGTGGVKKGTLSTSLSFLMMGPAKAFTKTYTLGLPHDSVLTAGDCGSWVVDPSTCEVYGHVVASDAMGDTYVVPLNATLRDMEKKLGAGLVSLPTEADIHTWLAQHAKALANQVKVPARSKKKKVAFNDSNMVKAEFSKDLQKLAGHSISQASMPPAPSAIKTSTPIVDYCNSCEAKFEGTSQDVRSNLLCHLRTCARHNNDAAPESEIAISEDAKDTADKWPKRSSVKDSKDARQKTTDNTSTQQTRPIPGSIRSMYSSFRRKSNSDSQQKDGNKSKSISNSKDNEPIRSAYSNTPAATASPTSTAKDLKNNTKKSNTKKVPASPPISKGLPAPSSALAGRISGDLPYAPPAPPIVPDHRQSLPIATPLSPLPRQGGNFLASPSPPAPPLVLGHRSFHEDTFNPQHLSHNSNSGQLSYEGYTFTKCDSKQTGQKETWAVATMTPMPVSQEDLKDQIKRNRKRHISALDEYNDDKMKGFKRKQVDNLIGERTKIDGDYGYEYVLASIKLDSRKTKRKSTETMSMQVILKRQLRVDFPPEPSMGLSLDFHERLPSQTVDLTGRDEPEKISDYGVGSNDRGFGATAVSFAGHPEYGAFPMHPVHGQSVGHRGPILDFRLPLNNAAIHPLDSLTSPAQRMIQPPHPHSIPLSHQEIHNTQGLLARVNHSKDNKKKAPKVVLIQSETRKKRDYLSKSPSLSDFSSGLESDNSWAKTDATPDTVVSGESREYRREKKSHKGSKESSHDKDSIKPTPYVPKTERPVYSGHRREEHRRSSLSPPRKPRDVSSDWIHPRQDFDLDLERHDPRATSQRCSYGTRYRDHGHYEVEPATSFPANRDFRNRGSSVSPERPSHRQPLSYDLDRSLAHNSRSLVPMHRERDLHGHGAELAREQEGWERVGLRDEARARRMREIERYEREERDARMERVIEMERRGRVIVEGRESRRGTAYDDSYLSRRHRAPDHYY